ncbi:urease accessory protein UreF [Baaleninema simplex]|uniref:urease accessory protein UreF n=1 Tax=Baaleninema simplex TaxID=2862350 RepID=UPI000347AA0A|nr:urease accessory protein UreF [Baaleninema simplex]
MFSLLNLLQLVSPTLPLGAYSYSEGLETLVETQTLTCADDVRQWLETELRHGTIRIETAVMVRAYRSVREESLADLAYWNRWLSATRETAELQQQSWQMGNSLMRLLCDLDDPNALDFHPYSVAVDRPCNLAIAYGIAAAAWEISLHDAALGYLYSWATNLIGAAVKLVPLGQTAGQQLTRQLQPTLTEESDRILALDDDDLTSCSWGLTLASMQHETLYSRLFRS